jgi:hypothetical protein
VDGYDDREDVDPHRPPDLKQDEARAGLRRFFNENATEVFYSRQLEVLFEKKYLHWITYRAVQDLLAEKFISREIRALENRSKVHLLWKTGNRYYRRRARQVIRLINEYAHPTVTREIGDRGETLTLEGFARHQFIMHSRNSTEYQGRIWTGSDHNLDFIFERDGLAYGVEVKNTLPYMEREDFDQSIAICSELGIRPVHVVRRNPEPWLIELRGLGGFTLMLDYQLYPPLLEPLASRVREELRLPVAWPRAFWEGTMQRFLRWHVQLAQAVNSETDSPEN